MRNANSKFLEEHNELYEMNPQQKWANNNNNDLYKL